MAKSGQLNLHIYDSKRQPFRAGTVLVTLRDGFGREVHRKHHDANILNFKIELADNLRDRYTVVVAAEGRRDSGFTPVHLTADDPQDVHTMLTSKDPRFEFPNTFAELRRRSNVHALLEASGMTDAQYDNLKTPQNSAMLATLLNTLTSLDDISVGEHTMLLLYYKRVILDCLKPDRFYTQVDARLKRYLGENGQLYSKAGSGLHDARACASEVKSIKPIESFKQSLFLESNVQFTFYETNDPNIDVVENDMDYFADTGAHLLLEVFPNGISKIFGRPILTDPRQAYVLRWSQSKNLQCWRRDQTAPLFDPPFEMD